MHILQIITVHVTTTTAQIGYPVHTKLRYVLNAKVSQSFDFLPFSWHQEY